MSVLRFTYPGPPVAQARPRVTRRGAFRPDANRRAEERLRAAMLHEARRQGWRCTSDPLRLFLWFTLPVPASWPKWRRRAAHGAAHTGRPDIDNLQKLVADAGNGVLWADDAAIAMVEARKVYGDEPCTFVLVSRLDPLPARRPAA